MEKENKRGVSDLTSYAAAGKGILKIKIGGARKGVERIAQKARHRSKDHGRFSPSLDYERRRIGPRLYSPHYHNKA